MTPLRTETWVESRDTFWITVPTAVVEVEPEFGGPGTRVSMHLPAASHRAAIEALRGLLDELEDMEPKT